MTTHQHHHHTPHGAVVGGVDVDPRCDGCGKRHTQGDFFTPPASHRGSSIPTARSSSKIVSIAALLLVASVAATESTTALPLPTNNQKWGTSSSISVVAKKGWSSISHVFGGAGGPDNGLAFPPLPRRLQEANANETAEEHEEEEHHDEEDHEGEDHEGEEEGHSDHEDEATESDELQQSKRAVWTQVIGATFLINLATLVGVVVLFTNNIHGYFVKKGFISKSTPNQNTVFDILILSFAAGALLATAVFLILPEAIEMIGGGHDGDSTDSEGTVAAKFGCSFLGGFLLPLVIAIIFHKNDDEVGVSHTRPSLPAPADVSRFDAVIDTGMSVGGGDPSFALFQEYPKDNNKDAEEQQPQDLSPRVPINQDDFAIVKPIINKKLILSVLLGDAFHNCADGILIAYSFVSCDIAMAISIAGITIVHELAQELGDFILLTKHGGLTICQALILNFLSGLTVILGAVIFLLANPSDQATGVMLTIGAGVYVNIAATETIPRLDQISKTRMHRVWTLIGCIVGTIPIGLVLLNHHHCVAEGAHEHNH